MAKSRQTVLTFDFRGAWWEVNKRGEIRMHANDTVFSNTWIFKGGSRHHWSNHIDVTFFEAWKDPSLLNGCLLWDNDHGSTRRHSGAYCGKLPRIRNAYKEMV